MESKKNSHVRCHRHWHSTHFEEYMTRLSTEKIEKQNIEQKTVVSVLWVDWCIFNSGKSSQGYSVGLNRVSEYYNDFTKDIYTQVSSIAPIYL